MLNLGTNRRSMRGRSSRRGGSGRASLAPLLHSSHVFASMVREILDLGPLRQALPHPLTPAQCSLLRLICLNGAHPVGQVASLLGISAPAATRTVDKLERLGLIVRCSGGGDRRTRPFSVSRAGRELVRRCEDLIAARLRAALKDFEPREVDAFRSLLARFSVSLLAADPAVGGPCLRCAAYLDEACPVGRFRGGCPYGDVLERPARAKRPRRARKVGAAC